MGSNALAALAIKPVQQPSVLDTAGKALGLQQAMQQIQGTGQENQVRQNALDEAAAIKQAVAEAGGDLRKAMPKIMQVAPIKGASLQKDISEWDTADITKKKSILDLNAKKAQRLGELAGSATDQQSYQQAIDTAHGEGALDDTEYHVLASQPYNPATVKQFQMQSMTAKEQLDAAAKDLDDKDKKAKDAATAAETKRHNEATEIPAPEREFQAFYSNQLAANGKPKNAANEMSARTDYAKWKKSISAAASGTEFTPDALDMAAQMFSKTGQLPSLGMGSAAATARAQILNRAAQLNKENGSDDPATNKANYTAMSSALKDLTKQQQAIGAYESTAKANLDLFEQQAKKVIDTGSPWVNKPLRAIDRGALGSTDQVAYDVARQVALTEIARVVNNPNLNGVLSDSARKEIEGLTGDGATMAQLYKAAGILRQDMANRKKGNGDQIIELQGHIKDLGAKPGVAASPANAGGGGAAFTVPAGAPPAPSTDGKVLKMDGKVIAKSKGGQWADPNSQ